MGDLISRSWGPGTGAWGPAAVWGVVGGLGAPLGDETITCPSPEAPSPTVLPPCPALETRTDDHAPNRPRRISMAPTSGASVRICTIRAMVWSFMTLQ